MPPRVVPIELRYWKYVRKTPRCWYWTGAKTGKGYGLIHAGGKVHYAHRVAAYLSGMKFDARLEICHRCDRPSCVNPKHLFVGTHADNMRDAKEKGLMHLGEAHGMAKLNRRDVKAIRLLYPRFTELQIAKFFNITRGCVSDIRRGRNWGWLKSR